MDDVGQVSAEVLVLLAALMAIAFVVVSQFSSTSQEYKKSITHTRSNLAKEIRKIK